MIVIKVGGEILEDDAVRAVAADVAELAARGERIAMVHGGGPQATAMQRRLGIDKERYEELLETRRGAPHWATYWSGTHIVAKRAKTKKGDGDRWWNSYRDVNTRSSFLKAYGAERLPGHWLFSVRDNGIGMSGECLCRVFATPGRACGRSPASGTHRGLTSCMRILDRCGGRIWAHSRPGLGATIHFTIPAAEETHEC